MEIVYAIKFKEKNSLAETYERIDKNYKSITQEFK
jgi:hypothetical protein